MWLVGYSLPENSRDPIRSHRGYRTLKCVRGAFRWSGNSPSPWIYRISIELFDLHEIQTNSSNQTTRWLLYHRRRISGCKLGAILTDLNSPHSPPIRKRCIYPYTYMHKHTYKHTCVQAYHLKYRSSYMYRYGLSHYIRDSTCDTMCISIAPYASLTHSTKVGWVGRQAYDFILKTR